VKGIKNNIGYCTSNAIVLPVLKEVKNLAMRTIKRSRKIKGADQFGETETHICVGDFSHACRM
jgi:hypothetical protein